MRIALVAVQTAVILTMIFVSVLAGGGLASLTAVGAGVGPAAIGAGMYILALFAAAAAGFAVFVVPISLMSAASLLFALLSGYRHLRWCRFAGVLANLAGIAYFVALYVAAQIGAPSLLVPLLILPVANCVLFLLVPRRPNVRLTHTAVLAAIPLIYAILPLICALAILNGETSYGTSAWIGFAIIFAIHTLPHYFAFRTIPATQIPGRRLLIRLAILFAIAALELVVVFPMGLPLAVCALLLLALAEMRILYPDVMPPQGGALYWLARTLGRLPERTAAISPTPSQKETDHHEAVPETEPPPPGLPAAR